MSSEQLRLSYALAKQVPAMARGFTISTSYGDIEVDAEDAEPFLFLASRLLHRQLNQHVNRVIATAAEKELSDGR